MEPAERHVRSHRHDGRAQLAAPAGSFREEVRRNPHEVLMVAVGGLLAVLWGGSTLVNDGPAWQRGLGLLAALAGALVWISYFLRFWPALIEDERWSRTRTRRALRGVLVHAWAVFFALAILAWLITRF
jgi:hypothetical protein